MRGFGRKTRRTRSAAKVVTAALVGSAVGAALSLLMNPTRVAELRRRMTGKALGVSGAHERMKTAEGNVEDRVRELVGHVSPGYVQETASRGGKSTLPPS